MPLHYEVLNCYGALPVRRPYLTLTCLLCLTGCLWRSYGEILSVHLSVLTATADKLCAVAQAGEGPTAEGMAEYVYPLQRGHEFLRQFSKYRERQSYGQFTAFLERYEAMVHTADAARTQGRLATEVPQLNAQRDTLQQLAADIRSSLEAGK